MKMSNSLDQNTAPQLALYNNGLKGLQYQAHQNPGKALKQTAQQFESLFLNEMLKSMRDSIPDSGLINSDQINTFTGMLDQQLSQDIATHRGIGLANLLIRQLTPHPAPEGNALKPLQPQDPAPIPLQKNTGIPVDLLKNSTGMPLNIREGVLPRDK